MNSNTSKDSFRTDLDKALKKYMPNPKTGLFDIKSFRETVLDKYIPKKRVLEAIGKEEEPTGFGNMLDPQENRNELRREIKKDLGL